MFKFIVNTVFALLLILPLALGYMAFKSLEKISSKIVSRAVQIERSTAGVN